MARCLFHQRGVIEHARAQEHGSRTLKEHDTTRIRTLITTPRLTAALLACVMAVSLMFPALAVADDATRAWASAEIYHLEPGKTPTLVILAQLAEEIALPAETSLAIPKTSTLSWAGEIHGGDTANDPTL